MSVREVDIALKKINMRLRNDFVLNAKLHGVELKSEVSSEKVKFDKEKDKILTDAIEKMNKERFGE